MNEEITPCIGITISQDAGIATLSTAIADQDKSMLFGSFESLNMLLSGFDNMTPEQLEAARARADARDYADMTLAAHLEAAPKTWCIQRDPGVDGVEVMAVFATEEAATEALPRFEHMDYISIALLPFFAA